MKTEQQIILELGEPPLCACGCGNRVSIHEKLYSKYKRIGYNKFLPKHHGKGKYNALYNSKIHKTLEDLIIEFGEIPLCKCGCGNKVNVSTDRKSYNKYKKNNGFNKNIHGHHAKGTGNPMYNVHLNGKLNPMYNKHHTEKSKRKISQSRKRIVDSEETRKRKSEFLKEYHRLHPDLCVGKNNPNYGKPAWNKGIEWYNMKGTNHPLFEKEVSLETRLKQSKNHRDISGNKNPIFSIKYQRGLKIHYKSSLQGEICFRSTYELKYAQYLDSIGEEYYYELKAFPLIINGKDTTYTPDFYLPNKNTFVEIKGWLNPEAQFKIEKFKELYKNYNFELLFKKDLQNLGIKL